MNLRVKLRNNPLNALYQEANLPREISRSLSFIILGNFFGTLHGIICGGNTTAMISLATYLGAGDLALGILASIPQVAAFLQIPFSILVNRTHKRKKYLLTFGLFSRALWMTFGLVPLLKPIAPAMLPLWTLIFLLGISSCCGSFINVCWFPWMSDLLPLKIRGRYLSLREIVMAGCNLIFGFLVARLLDALPVESRYIVIFIIGGMTGMADMLCYAFCKEVFSAPPQQSKLSTVFKDVFANRRFRSLIVMWTAWCFSANFAGVYLTPYAMNEMGLNFTQMMIFGTIASAVATILIMPFWGRLLDRFGCRNVMMVAGVGTSLAQGFYLLATPGSVLPTFLHSFVGALFWSGANLSANSMQLSYSPDETRPSYIAVFSCVTALIGATLGSLSGGALLEFLEARRLFTGSFDRYKMVILLAVVLRLAFVLLLVPRMENDREESLQSFLRFLNPTRKLHRR